VKEELSHQISEADSLLTHELHRFMRRITDELDCVKVIQSETLDNVRKTRNTIMSAISDFATAQNAFNDQIDTAVAGLTGDIAALNAKINELQNSPGAITPADQALLDAIQSRAAGVATKLTALDDLTAPAIPTNVNEPLIAAAPFSSKSVVNPNLNVAKPGDRVNPYTNENQPVPDNHVKPLPRVNPGTSMRG
jgi:hypothetical protein